jgi:hypothetical protein
MVFPAQIPIPRVTMGITRGKVFDVISLGRKVVFYPVSIEPEEGEGAKIRKLSVTLDKVLMILSLLL